MPTPTIPAGNLYMNATLYTGNSGTQTITNGVAGQSFQPDLVWAKARSAATDNQVYDSVRGVTKDLYTNLTLNEQTITDGVTAFNSNGFTVGANGPINGSGVTLVAWQWKANGTAVSNTSGSITSQVSANTTSGFSVVTYTNVASGVQTVGHGLGVAPSMIIVKFRSGTSDWFVYHSSIGNTATIKLNSAAAIDTSSAYWNNTSPTSSVFTLGTQWNGTATAVAYCWAEIAGFSKFGSYTGNGSTDGPFIYTGFRPRWVMIKSTAADVWEILDSSRNTYNVANLKLFAEQTSTEFAANCLDFVSNGFKIRASSANTNSSGQTYIYACFAENPFKYANAR